MKDLHDIAEPSAILAALQFGSTLSVYTKVWCKYHNTFSVFQYVLNLLPGIFLDALTVLSLWENVRVFAEMRRRYLFVYLLAF